MMNAMTGSARYNPRFAAMAALAVLIAASGCKSAPPAAGTDDASLNAAVQSRLASDPGLSGENIQVAVQDGVATLTGTADSAAARGLAANDTAQIAGIHTVVNNVALAPTSAAAPAPVVPAPVAPVSGLTRREAERERRKKARNTPPPPPYQAPAPIDRRAPEVAQNEAQPQPQPTPPPPTLPPAPAFHNVNVPAGTRVPVRVTQTLDSASTQSGTTFSGVLASDVIVDGVVAFPAGTHVTGHVDEAKDAGHFSGHSLLAVSLTAINRHGESIPISTETFSKEGDNRGKNSAEKIGGGAAVGAILGGIFGGGKGAAIGAGAGGGLGAGAQGVTRGQQVQIPSESVVSFRLTAPVTVRVSNNESHEERERLHQDQ
jgi:hypothetical protein